MNALQLTALVCLGLVLLFAGVLAVAWVHDRFVHHEPLMGADMNAALASVLQVALCVLFGLAIAWIYYLGWCATWP